MTKENKLKKDKYYLTHFMDEPNPSIVKESDLTSGHYVHREVDLVELIQKWFKDRNLHDVNPTIQLSKTIEELGELATAIRKEDKEQQMDGVGDTVVTLIGISMQLGLDFNDCLAYAYNEIKDRKGKKINGIFVKSDDL